MAGAFVSRLPAPKGKSLVEGSPITLLCAAVDELQRGAAAGLSVSVDGLDVSVSMRDNVLHISGRVDPKTRRTTYDDDAEDGDDGHEGRTGDDTTPDVPPYPAPDGVTANVTVVTGFDLEMAVVDDDGVSKLQLDVLEYKSTLSFRNGMLVDVTEEEDREWFPAVAGTDCDESESGA